MSCFDWTRRTFLQTTAVGSATLGADAPQLENWIRTAEALKPKLRRTSMKPLRQVRAQHDEAAFQKWSMADGGPLDPLWKRPLRRGDNFTLDFGTHLTGYLRFSLIWTGRAMDAPVRLKFTFGEVPSEIGEPFDPYHGTLSRAWLQDETVTIDVLPKDIELPRRYSFRYVKVEVIDTSPEFQVQFQGIECAAVTSVTTAPQPLPASAPALWRDMDRIGLNTLRECMQTVFEDGPKRDRRLWIGDVRVQALTNYASFKNYDLVKRCLYLFAGLPREDGLIPSCVFEEPRPLRGHVFIMDYAALFGTVVLDYAKASGDWQTAKELWPVAKRQLDLIVKYVNADGLFVDPGGWWIFIDWHPQLDKQAPMLAVLVYSLRNTAELGEHLGKKEEAAEFRKMAVRMTEAAQRGLLDRQRGVFVSGKDKQVSWASQAWMVLAGIAPRDSAVQGFASLKNDSSAITPKTPYLYHHVVDAMLTCGMKSEAIELLESYWGGMVKKGADTFWEVYDPNDQFLSPYNSYLVNSYCHAWSCTPAYFLRTRLA